MRDPENGERGRGYIMFDGKRGGGSKTRFMVILFRKISLISFSFLFRAYIVLMVLVLAK